MIARHMGGEAVRGGIYWSLRAGEFVAVPSEGGKLEGGPESRYIRAPLPVVLIVGPVLGLAFAIFLPLSGLLVLVPFLAGKLRAAVAPAKMSAAHMASPRMQPGMSYLEPGAGSRSEKQGEQPESDKPEGKIVNLAEEIAEKRWQEK